MDRTAGIAATGSDYSRAHAAACHAGYDRNGSGCGLRARTRSPLRGHLTGCAGYPHHEFSHRERRVMMHLSLLIILLIFGGAILAGVLGALVGLGGGTFIVPLLTLAFGLPIQYGIGVCARSPDQPAHRSVPGDWNDDWGHHRRIPGGLAGS